MFVRESQDGVLGEQPLVRRQPAEAEAFVRMVERELELAPAARTGAVLGFGRQPQSHLPQELAPREPEAVASPDPHEMLDGGALEIGGGTADEVADAQERTAPLPLEHEGSRRLLAP